MTIEKIDGGVIVTGKDIETVRLLALRGALHLESIGMKRRGRSVLSVVKAEFGFKGNSKKVYREFCIILAKRGITHPKEEKK